MREKKRERERREVEKEQERKKKSERRNEKGERTRREEEKKEGIFFFKAKTANEVVGGLGGPEVFKRGSRWAPSKPSRSARHRF